jgi:hypothetical protein
MICVLMLSLVVALPRGCDLMWGNAPMNLYGKLVDQMGNPVADVPVFFTASANTRFQLPILLANDGETTWLVHGTTTKDGTFRISAGWGQVLYPGRSGDLGYLNGNTPGPFEFGRNAHERNFHGDPNHPVMFIWWNDSFKRIISRDVTAQVGHDLYTLSYRSGRVSPYGIGDENLHFRIVRPGGNPPRPYDWSIEIRSVYQLHGELAEANGALKPEAPEKGYVHELLYTMKANDPHWSPQMTKRFYTRGQTGDVYAGVELTASLGINGADPTVTIHYTANFGKSRDLVPGPVKPAGN